MMNKKFGAVIVAAGNSSRMGGERTKVLEPLGGKPLLRWSLEALEHSPEVGEIVVVCRDGDKPEMAAAAAGLSLPVAFVTGGRSRQESVRLGVEALGTTWGYILIHDGARPLVTPEVIGRVCHDALEYGAATAAVPSKDTCKLGEDFVEETPPREKLFAVQTPQAFRKELYLTALRRAEKRGETYTDDCQLLESAGEKVRLTRGDYRNIKLTTPEDMAILRAFAENQRGDEFAENQASDKFAENQRGDKQKMRIGYGYDVHRLAENRKLILGGVEIPFELGLLGHSDADVLTHAVADALLGAAALGDIGKLFPDTDPRFEGADSLKLLRKVCELLTEHGYAIGNVDCTLIAQRPKIAPYIIEMRQKLASACGVDVDKISVKATTEEGLGFTGTGQGMAASAVALLEEKQALCRG